MADFAIAPLKPNPRRGRRRSFADADPTGGNPLRELAKRGVEEQESAPVPRGNPFEEPGAPDSFDPLLQGNPFEEPGAPDSFDPLSVVFTESLPPQGPGGHRRALSMFSPPRDPFSMLAASNEPVDAKKVRKKKKKKKKERKEGEQVETHSPKKGGRPDLHLKVTEGDAIDAKVAANNRESDGSSRASEERLSAAVSRMGVGSPKWKPPPPTTPSPEHAKRGHRRALTSVQNMAAPTLPVNVLKFMREGTPFLKYGRRGFPHFRLFHLADDNQRLVWYSKNKKLSETQLQLADVDRLLLGQTTPNFQRHRAPELSRSSFSIIFQGGRKSLDLVAKDHNEFTIWYRGLKQLVEMAHTKSYRDIAVLTELVIRMPVERGRRSSQAIIEAAGMADQLGHFDKVVDNPRLGQSGDKQMHKEVFRGLNTLKKRYAKDLGQVRGKFFSCKEYDLMLRVLHKVKDSIGKISLWYPNGEYMACDDETWRASVDLEALESMMQALKSA